MTLTFKFYVDWNQDNDFADTYEDITADVERAFWRLGMMRAFQTVASESTAEITVRNTTGKYNPDNSSSVIYGYLHPYRPVKITANDGGGEQTMWRGWIETIEPEWAPASTYAGKTTATIRCIGLKDILETTTVLLPLQEDKYADEIIDLVLQYVALPPAVPFGWLLGIPGQSELGVSTWLAGATDYSSVESGTGIFAYYGDVQNDDIEKDPPTGYAIIRDVTEAERGFFYFSRAGKAVFWNKDHFYDDAVVDDTLDSTGALGIRPRRLHPAHSRIVNDVEVTGFQRDIENAVVLWSLDATMTITIGQTVQFDAPYTDEYRNRAGAKDVTATGATYSSGTATITINEGADRAIVSIYNGGAVDAVLTALNLQGTIIRSRRPMTVRKVDSASISNYGHRADIKLRLRALDNYEQLLIVAERELLRHKDPRLDINRFELINQVEQLNWGIGTRLRVIDAGLSHDADYFIVGEQHSVRENAKIHETAFVLEPAVITRLATTPLRFYDTEAPLMSDTAYDFLAQGFEVSAAKSVVKARLRLRKAGSPTGSLTLKLFANKSYTTTWILGEAGFSELGVTTRLVPEDVVTVTYDQDTEPTFVDVGTVSAGTTFTHTADFELWYEADTLPSVGTIDLFFRVQDASNYWKLSINTTGGIELFEVVAATPTSRDSAAAVVSNGSIIRLTASSSTIIAYVDNTEQINYASASNFATETDGELDALGTGGVVKDLAVHRDAPAAVVPAVTALQSSQAGSIAAGTAFTHPANCKIVFTLTTLPASSYIPVAFRSQTDETNEWFLAIFSTGVVSIYETIAAVDTFTGAGGGAATVSGGEEIAIICEDEFIAVEIDGSRQIQYPLAVNFKTETSGEIQLLPGGAAISDLSIYSYESRTITEAYYRMENDYPLDNIFYRHPADCVIRWDYTTVPASNTDQIQFRRNTAGTQFWHVNITSTKTVQLYKFNVSSTLIDASGAGAVVAGDVVEIICNGATISVQVNGVEVCGTSNATDYKTNVRGFVNYFGAPGSASGLLYNFGVYPYPGNAAALTSNFSWMNFAFESPVSLSTSTRYWLRLETTDYTDADNYVSWASSDEPYLVGLSAFWDLDADGNDDHHRGHDLTNNNGVTWNSDGWAVFSLASPNSFLSLTDHGDFRPGYDDFMMTFDYRLTGSFTDAQYIVQKWDFASSLENEILVWIVAGTLTFFLSYDGTNYTQLESSVAMEPHTDYRITLWRDYNWLTQTGTMGVSVNGTESTTAYNTVVFGSTSAFLFGATDGWMRRFGFWKGFTPTAAQRTWINTNKPTYSQLDNYITGDFQRRADGDGWERLHADSIFEVLA